MNISKRTVSALSACVAAAALFVFTGAPAEAAPQIGGNPEKCLPTSVTPPANDCPDWGFCTVTLNYVGTGFANCEGCGVTGTRTTYCGGEVADSGEFQLAAACKGQAMLTVPCPDGGPPLGNIVLKCGKCK